MYTHTNRCMYMHACVSVCDCVHTCTCAKMHIYTRFTCVYMCIHIYLRYKLSSFRPALPNPPTPSHPPLPPPAPFPHLSPFCTNRVFLLTATRLVTGDQLPISYCVQHKLKQTQTHAPTNQQFGFLALFHADSQLVCVCMGEGDEGGV